EPHAVHGVVERLHPGLAGRTAVRTPVSLVGAGLRAEHDEAMVLVAVGDEPLVSGRVHAHVRRAPEVRGVTVAPGHAGLADLEQELSIRRELQDLMVLLTAAGDPHVVLVVYED